MRRRRALLTVVALGALTACGSGDVLVPVTRLADGSERATIGTDTRPVLQAYPQHLLFRRPAVRVPGSGATELVVEVPGELGHASELVVEPLLQLRGAAAPLWARRLPVAADGSLRLEFDSLPAATQVHMYAMARRPVGKKIRTMTPPLEIPPRAELGFAMGIAPVANDQGPVLFRVLVCEDDCQTLWEERFDPGGADSGWSTRTVSLAAVAGRTVAFHFETVHQNNEAGAFSFPMWAAPTVYAPRVRERPDLLLISIDTLRADHLPTYGYARDTAPFVDSKLAGPGVVFEQCVSAATTTGPSHMTMFTSLQPSVHQIMGSTRGVLPENAVTLAEILHAHGYATGAFTENAAIVAPRGFVRGFDTYVEIKEVERKAPLGHIERTLADGLAWLEHNRGRQSFLFLHTYQVHTPYRPPAAYAELFAGDDHPFDPALDHRPNWHPNLYDREIRYTDDALADFFSRARAAGLLENAIVIFTSDHGEAFLEHGVYAHGPDIHEEVLHVPLIFTGPGVPSGRRVTTPVGLVDLMPTLLDLVGAPIPEGVMGQSFAALLQGEGDEAEFENRPIFSEAWWRDGLTASGTKRIEIPLFAVRRGMKKLVRWPRGADFSFAYYDLERDPGEQDDLYDPQDAEIAALRELVARYPGEMAALRNALLSGDQPELVLPDPERAEKLRALGYVE